MIFKLIGALGLILISIGILNKQRKIQDVYYIFGGLCLLAYSVEINEVIFIILQAVFTLVAGYDLFRTKREIRKNKI